MRMLNARLVEQAKAGIISEEIATNAASPLRKLKSVFPNSTLSKHTPMDVYLTPPSPNRPRALVIRDLGSIENDWVATELVLSYFGETGPSPPVCPLAMVYLYTEDLLVEEDCFREPEDLPKVKGALLKVSLYLFLSRRKANYNAMASCLDHSWDHHLIFHTCWWARNAWPLFPHPT